MKRRAAAFLILTSLIFGASVFTDFAYAASSELPKKRPAKQKKKTFVDFSKQDEGVLVVPTPLDRILKKSDKDVLVVRTRKIIAAPQGDSAEPLSAFEAKPKSIAAKPSLPPSAPRTAVTTTPTVEAEHLQTRPSAPVAAAPLAVLPPPPTEAPVTNLPPRSTSQISQTTVLPPAPLFVGPPSPSLREKFEPETIETTTTTTHESVETESFTASRIAIPATTVVPTTAAAPAATSAMAFFRAGFLNANYKKFDDRMNNAATSLGLGVGRGFETDWGSFEARAALDAYHAMDQSVTVDNIRMLSARTEIAYWISHARVKPGISLGLGWVDYSIRSYRAVSGDDERNVTIRTHAKGRAFSIIPGTSLRIEIGHGLVIDTQTEFVALLGGEGSDAAQGFGATVGLGWIF